MLVVRFLLLLSFKSMLHVCNIECIPGQDDILIEGRGTTEHVIHVCHFGCIPGRDIFFEQSGSMEHAFHVGGIRHIPRRDIVIECFVVAEDIGKVMDVGNIPFVDGISIRRGKFFSLLERTQSPVDREDPIFRVLNPALLLHGVTEFLIGCKCHCLLGINNLGTNLFPVAIHPFPFNQCYHVKIRQDTTPDIFR